MAGFVSRIGAAAFAGGATVMDLYTKLCAGLLFPLHERLKSHGTVVARRALEKSQWWSPDEIKRAQAEKLRAFLVDIGERVPYYRRLFAASSFDPRALTGVPDLARLPLLSKSEIRAHVDAMKAVGAVGLVRYNTGGSSGEPLVFFTSVGRRTHDVAAKWRATRWWDVDIGDRELVVWGSPVELNAQDRVRALRDAIMRSWLLPAFDMSEASMDRYIETIRRVRPAMLFGYPSSLSLIARHARSRNVPMNDLGVKVAFVTSERLYDDQRDAIATTFGCRVANGYGGRDAGFIAHECPSGRMHISGEDIVVEILDAQGRPVPNGESGEIVVTHLATGDFPFVRYRTGDMGVIDEQPCPCGRGLPVLGEIQGRSTDFVVANDGTVMHGLALIYVLRALAGIEAFKIVQHDRTHVEVLIVPGAEFSARQEQQIQHDFRKRLGQDTEVDIKIVDSIPRESSGKYRYVVSKVAPAVAMQAD